MFEGLFVRALAVEPRGTFSADLRAAGFDLADVRPLYDISVWAACLDVAWRHAYPAHTRDDAWRLLGRRFIEGYFETPIGRAIAATLPFMRAERFLERVPWFLRTGLGGSTAEVSFPAPGEASLLMFGPHPRSALVMSGVIDGCFERMGARGAFTATALEGDDSRLDIRWVDAR